MFEKLRFRDGLVWTVDLTLEIMLRFQIPPPSCGRCLKRRGPPAPARVRSCRQEVPELYSDTVTKTKLVEGLGVFS